MERPEECFTELGKEIEVRAAQLMPEMAGRDSHLDSALETTGRLNAGVQPMGACEPRDHMMVAGLAEFDAEAIRTGRS